MNLILLIGNKTDPHIKGICSCLEDLQEKFIVLDKIDFSDSITINYKGGKLNSKIRFDNQIILNSEIKSVWNSTALKIVGKDDLLEESQKFATVEWTEGINSLWQSVNALWVNSPYSIFNSANRLHQLDLANDVGLDCPETLITNNADELIKFYNGCNQNIVAKTLGSSEGLPEGKMIFTNKISKNNLEKLDNLKYSPTFFQEYIPKQTELRITIIGSKIHAVEIHSQKSEKTKDDWRHYDDFKKTPYLPVTLDKEVVKKLQKLMQKLGLVYGAIDMIKTPDGNLVFLEVNANGRWWWIQELTGLDIAKDVALTLSKN